MSARAALEPVEEPRHELVGDAVTGVRDDDPDELVPLARLDADRRLAVAGGVRDEIRDDPVEDDRIGDHRNAGIDVDLDHAGRGRICDLLQHLAQHEWLGVDRDRVRVEPGQVEQLLDEAAHPVGLLPGRLFELAAHVVAERVASLAEGRQDPVDRGRRGAQLVRCHGDEAQLQLVEGDHLVVHARLLDRNRKPFRDQLQQLRLVAREQPRRQRPDVEHARDVLAHRERDAEEGLDALDPQQRVEHLGVLDVR